MLASSATRADRPRFEHCWGRNGGFVDKPCIGRPKSRAQLRVPSYGATGPGSSEVLAALPAISDCYDDALNRNSSERGDIVLKANVDPAGNPGEVSAELVGLHD
jgi:hypothetical protein